MVASRWLVLLIAALLSSCAYSFEATVTVTNVSDSGAGSLRAAITTANTDGLPTNIRFASALAGQTITTLTNLPSLTENSTAINGDLGGDGDPDIVIDADDRDYAQGLQVYGSGCVIRGLVIVRHMLGVNLYGDQNRVVGCNLGVGLDGATPRRNRSDVSVTGNYNWMGGRAARDRNVLCCGDGATPISEQGVFIAAGHHNTVCNSHFGISRDGLSSLGGEVGVSIYETSSGHPYSNTIGGTTAGSGNRFGGLGAAIVMVSTNANKVRGNVFGLYADGTVAPIGQACIALYQNCLGNDIGGAPSARNVFAGAPVGLQLDGAGNVANRVQGNYFGLNEAGTGQRPLTCGIEVKGATGKQQIGAADPARANYFCPKAASENTWGIRFSGAGQSTLVRGNRFGVRPDGANALPLSVGIEVNNVPVSVSDNVIARCGDGVRALGASGKPTLRGNTLRGCTYGVRIAQDATCWLGNAASGPGGEGHNGFHPSNTWHVYNAAARTIKAEGNTFGTTSRSEIDAKIRDRLDDPLVGRVDFIPLEGGVVPTGGTLALTGAAATPTPRGAEIRFTLSAAADVRATVLNLAGRPVATLLDDSPLADGPQVLLWDGRGGGGLAAPAGRYLVEVEARAEDGQTARCVLGVTLHR